MMTKQDVTAMVYEKKRAAGLTWASIAEGIGMSEVFVTSACLGMNSLPKDKAMALANNLGLPQPQGDSMRSDVERWAADDVGCLAEPIAEGWNAEEKTLTKKAKSKTGTKTKSASNK